MNVQGSESAVVVKIFTLIWRRRTKFKEMGGVMCNTLKVPYLSLTRLLSVQVIGLLSLCHTKIMMIMPSQTEWEELQKDPHKLALQFYKENKKIGITTKFIGKKLQRQKYP